MEMNRNLHRKHHMMIDCVPVDKEVGDMAPIYFKVSSVLPYIQHIYISIKRSNIS